LSGYSRFPVHEPGNPLAFAGLLLVKGVRFRLTYSPFICRVQNFAHSYSPMTHRNACPSLNSTFRFCQRHDQRSTAFRRWITCACALLADILKLVLSQLQSNRPCAPFAREQQPRYCWRCNRRHHPRRHVLARLLAKDSCDDERTHTHRHHRGDHL
jgi:hypothetical protein